MDHYQALSRFCAYQERCLSEIENKLRELNAPGEDWNTIINSLRETDLWNESRFACSFARGKFRIKSWGRVRIKQELKARSVSAELIKEALKEIEEDSYLESALKLARKKLKEVKSDSELSRRSKVYRYLIQKGYESDLLTKILRTGWEEAE